MSWFKAMFWNNTNFMGERGKRVHWLQKKEKKSTWLKKSDLTFALGLFWQRHWVRVKGCYCLLKGQGLWFIGKKKWKMKYLQMKFIHWATGMLLYWWESLQELSICNPWKPVLVKEANIHDIKRKVLSYFFPPSYLLKWHWLF